MTAYKKKMKDGAPVVVGAPPANTVKSDSEEEWKEDDEQRLHDKMSSITPCP